MAEGQAEARLSPWAALQHRNFALLWSGQLVHMLGAWMQQIVRAWHIYQLTDSPIAVGFVAFVGVLPVMVFSVVGGAFADTMDRRRLIVITQSAAMGLTILLGPLPGRAPSKSG